MMLRAAEDLRRLIFARIKFPDAQFRRTGKRRTPMYSFRPLVTASTESFGDAATEMRLEREATLVHEEHKPITLSPGLWEVDQVRTIDHLTGMVSRVVD